MSVNKSIVCFAPNDWWGMNPSCATHIMLRLSRDNKVLFVNPFSSDLSGGIRRGIGSRILRKARSVSKFLRRPHANLYVFSPVFLPFQGKLLVDALNNTLLKIQLKLVSRLLGFKKPVLWVENPRAADILDIFDASAKVYHVSDLFSQCAYASNRQMLAKREAKIVESSDMLIGVSRRLCDLHGAHHKNVRYLPHGVDFDLFYAASRQPPVMPELAQVRKPIAGYFGTLTFNNDIDLLYHCARQLPDVSFVFAGQITGGDYSALAALKNVKFLGKMPYEKVPQLAANFDVCMLPWKVNEWIRSCNPLKLFEYMAAGKPVVSVQIDEVGANYGHVISIAQDKEQFCRMLQWELANDTPVRREQRVKIAQQHSWDHHCEVISKWIAEIRNGQ